MIVQLRDELAIARQEVEPARQTTSALNNAEAPIPEEIHLETPQPEFVSQQIPLAAAFDNAQPNAAPPATDSVTSWVQLGAFKNPNNARTVWLKLRRTQSDLLSDLHHEFQRVGQEGRGTLHLLQVGPLMNATDAKTLCHNLAERNVECLAIRRIP
jgi:cell division septation protein DedD